MKKINDSFIWFCKMSIIIMVPFMTAIILLQVVMRYVFMSPFSWPEELARFLLIWLSCLGAAFAVREGLHISVVFIKNKFPERMKPVVMVVIHFLVIGFFMICVIEGFKLSFSQWIEHSAALQISMTFPLLGIPVGFGMMIMFTLELLIEDIRKEVSQRSMPETSDERSEQGI